MYGDGVKSSTVHSHYAIQTADTPAVIPHVVTSVKEVDSVIWDEAGMSSKRIFELVNCIHHKRAERDKRAKPF